MLAFAGWLSGFPLLASASVKYIPMAPSTAFCFSLVGISLVAHLSSFAWRWLPRLLAGAVVVVASAKVIEIVGGYHFGIDSWFVRNPGLFGLVPTGRVAPMTAINFLFVAAGVIALTSKRVLKSDCSLGALATVISLVILVGYWSGTPLLYGGKIIPVAFSTACGFFLSGLGIVASSGANNWPLRLFLGDETRAVLLRACVPWLVAAALINGWLNVRLPAHIHTNPAVTSALCAIIFTALLTRSISQVSHIVGSRIDRPEEARNAAQAELLALNAKLEERVRERTRQSQEKNRQMQEELQMARELQLALLPRKLPSVPSDAPADESALRFLSLYFSDRRRERRFFQYFSRRQKSGGRIHLRRDGSTACAARPWKFFPTPAIKQRAAE